MTNVLKQRKLASRVFGVGKRRIKVDPENITRVSLALSREDIRKHKRDGNIRVVPKRGVSRGRARAIQQKKSRGKRSGLGSRKGKKTARTPKKRLWINKIRLQREYLRELRDGGYLTPSTYRVLYRQAKGNAFRSKSYLRGQIENLGLATKRLPEFSKKKRRRSVS